MPQVRVSETEVLEISEEAMNRAIRGFQVVSQNVSASGNSAPLITVVGEDGEIDYEETVKASQGSMMMSCLLHAAGQRFTPERLNEWVAGRYYLSPVIESMLLESDRQLAREMGVSL